MKSMIKELWHGNINPQEDSRNNSPEMKELMEYILGGADSSKGGRDILNAINDKLLDELAMFMFENKQDLSSLKGSKILVKTTKNGLEFSFEND